MALSRTIFVAVAAVLCFTQILEASIVRRSTDTENTDLQQSYNRTRQSIDNFVNHTTVILTDTSQILATRFNSLLERVQQEITTGDGHVSTAFTNLSNHLNSTVTDLQNNDNITKVKDSLKSAVEAGREVAQSTNEAWQQYMSQFFDGLNTLLEEVTPTQAPH